MAKVTRFEDLEAWRRALDLAVLTRQLTNQSELSRDYSLRDQMRRAAVSVPANIAEGFERDGTAEFRQFLSIAKGSLGELKTYLYLAQRVEMISGEQFQEMILLANSTGRLIGGLMRYLAQSNLRGAKLAGVQPRRPPSRPTTLDRRPETSDEQQGTTNQAPATRNHRPVIRDPEPGTRDPVPGTRYQGPGTRDPELGTRN